MDGLSNLFNGLAVVNMVGFAVVLDALQSLILPEGLQLTRIPLIVVLGDFDQLLEIRSLFVLSILIGFNFFIQVV